MKTTLPLSSLTEVGSGFGVWRGVSSVFEGAQCLLVSCVTIGSVKVIDTKVGHGVGGDAASNVMVKSDKRETW